MKKIICIALLAVMALSFSGCTELFLLPFLAAEDFITSDGQFEVENNTGISIPRCEEIEYTNNTDFLGEGDIYIQLKVPENYIEDVEKSILREQYWQELPMDKMMSKKMEYKDGSRQTIEEYVGDRIPDIERGYWYFYSFEYSVDYLWDKDSVKMGAFKDFEICVCDTDTGMIYYLSYNSSLEY